MRVTAHIDARMNQRGITKKMIDLTLDHGEQDGDRIVLSAKQCHEAIQRLKQQMKAFERAASKGGIVVVTSGDTLITTYRADSFSLACSQKIRG